MTFDYPHIKRWSAKNALTLGFVWGLAESLFFFIVPDAGAGFLSMVSFRDGLKATAAAVVGGLVGGTLWFVAINVGGFHNADHYLLWIPGIHQHMLNTASQHISQFGANALLVAPFEGIPYKVYASHLVASGTSLPVLLLWSIPSRFSRILPVVVAAGIGGRIFRSSIQKHFRFWVGLYVLGWIGIYIVYFSIQ